MTGTYYSPHGRSMSRYGNAPSPHRYHFVTFQPRNNGKNHFFHQLVTPISRCETCSEPRITKAETLPGPGLVNPRMSLPAHEQMCGQRHRKRQVSAHLTGPIERGHAHDVPMRRQTHARPWA